MEMPVHSFEVPSGTVGLAKSLTSNLIPLYSTNFLAMIIQSREATVFSPLKRMSHKVL